MNPRLLHQKRQNIKTWKSLDIQTSRHLNLKKQNSKTKRSTFRLEAEVLDRMQTLCRRQSICREVLVEAMYEYIEDHPEAMNEVLVAANKKNEYRQQLANRKRAETMMNKFGGA
jgi:predicted DNA-binding protein